MDSKFCVMKIDHDLVYGNIINRVKDEYIELNTGRFPSNEKPRVGDVYDADYTMGAIAIVARTDEQFFELEAEVKLTTRLKHPVVASSREEAEKKFEAETKRIYRIRPYSNLSSEILDTRVDVDIIPVNT